MSFNNVVDNVSRASHATHAFVKPDNSTKDVRLEIVQYSHARPNLDLIQGAASEQTFIVGSDTSQFLTVPVFAVIEAANELEAAREFSQIYDFARDSIECRRLNGRHDIPALRGAGLSVKSRQAQPIGPRNTWRLFMELVVINDDENLSEGPEDPPALAGTWFNNSFIDPGVVPRLTIPGGLTAGDFIVVTAYRKATAQETISGLAVQDNIGTLSGALGRSYLGYAYATGAPQTFNFSGADQANEWSMLAVAYSPPPDVASITLAKSRAGNPQVSHPLPSLFVLADGLVITTHGAALIDSDSYSDPLGYTYLHNYNDPGAGNAAHKVITRSVAAEDLISGEVFIDTDPGAGLNAGAMLSIAFGVAPAPISYTPATRGTLALWMSADQVTGANDNDVLSAGVVVGAAGIWNERSSGLGPVYKENSLNGLPGLEIPLNSGLVIPGVGLQTQFSMLLVAATDDTNAMWLEHGPNAFTSANGLFITTLAANPMLFLSRSSAQHYTTHTGAWAANGVHLFEFQYSGVHTVSIDQNLVSNDTVIGSALGNVLYNDSLYIGFRADSSINSVLTLYEIYIFNESINPAQLAQDRAYLKGKWGI